MTRKLPELVVLMLVFAGGERLAAADGAGNEVRGLRIEETERNTVLRIDVAQEPTFSVFMLRNPSRLLVEIADCQADALPDVVARNGVVDKATLSLEKEGKSARCRVVLAFDQEADYDVQASASEILVVVDGQDRIASAQGDAQLQAQLQSRELELGQAREQLEGASAQLLTLKEEQKLALQRLATLETEQNNLNQELAKLAVKDEELSQARLRITELESKAANSDSKGAKKATAELERARQELQQLETDRASLIEKAERAETELSTLREKLELARLDFEASRAEATRQAELVALYTGQVEALKAENDLARQQLSLLSQERDAAALRASSAETRADELQGEVARLQNELAALELNATQSEALSAQLRAAEDRRQKLESELAAVEQAEQGDLQKAQAALAVANAESATLREQLAAAQSAANTDELKKRLLEKQNEAKLAKDEAEKLRLESESKVSELQKLIDERDRSLQSKESELAALRLQEEALRQELSEMKSADEKSELKQEEINELLQRQAQLRTEMEQELGTLRDTLQQRESALEKARLRETELATKYDELRLQREREQAAVQTLIDNKEGALLEAQEREQALRDELKALRSKADGGDTVAAKELQDKEAALDSAVAAQQKLQLEVDGLARKYQENQAELELVRGQAEKAATAAALRETQLSQELARVGELSRRTQEQLDAAALREAALQQTLAKQEQELTTLRQKLADAESARAEMQSLQVQLAEREQELAKVNEIKAQLSKAEAAQGEIERLQEELAQAELAREELRKLRTQVNNSESAAQELKTLREQVANADAARAELERLRAEVDASQQSAAELEALRNALAQQQELDDEVKRLRERVANAEKMQRDLDQLRLNVKSASAELEDERARNRQTAAELESAREQLASLREQLDSGSAQANNAPIDNKVATSAPATAPIDASAEKSSRPASVLGNAQVQDIRFEQDGVSSRVLVELDNPANYQSGPYGDGKATLYLEKSSLPEALVRKLDTRAFRGAVQFLSSFNDGEKVVLVAELDGASSELVRLDGNTLVWEFAADTAEDVAESSFVDRRQKVRIPAAPPRGSSSDGDITVTFGKTEKFQTASLSKRRITLDVRDIEINDLLRLIADEVGVSIVTSPDVSGRVTLSLKSVPLDQALTIILRAQDLGMRQEGNVIWVAKAQVFRDEERRALEAAIVRDKLEPLEVRLIPVNYASAEELQTNVEGLLSDRGSVLIDKRTNTLIVKDVGLNLDAVEILVESLDTQTPQILIEARIVETQSNYSKEIGVQWGGDFSFSPANGNPTGLIFPSSVGVAGASTSDANGGTVASPNFAVNLPAAVGTGSGGAVGMTFGSLGGAVNLSLRLSALEEKGFVKIVSAPRIMTLDNTNATIEQGVSIPVSVVSAAGVQTVFFDAKLNLSVTPHVTKDGNIFLKIDVQKNEPDFANTGAQGDPSIIRKEAHTQLLIPDGDTTVIGGIYTRNTAQGLNSVPFFGSLPFIGYFFRKTNETDNRTELLIFITPRIINRETSIGVSGPGSFIAPEPDEPEDGKKR
jgi:type IV pilus assembly protein PilQ